MRIRNPSNSLQNINNDSTVQRGWTSQPTKGMKRTRDEINNGISTIKGNKRHPYVIGLDVCNERPVFVYADSHIILNYKKFNLP